MKNLRLLAAAAALHLGMLGAANAATLQIVNGSAATIPNGVISNELLGPLGLANPLSGFESSSIALDGESLILVEYFGKEARYTNSFVLDGNTITTGANAASAVPLQSFVTGLLSGVLDFAFNVNSGAGSVANGSPNINIGSGPNFFASVVGNATGTSGDSLWLFLDDGGGRNDDDFDDMVMRLSVTAVPAPPAIWLLGTAVAGLAVRRFRSARKAVAA